MRASGLKCRVATGAAVVVGALLLAGCSSSDGETAGVAAPTASRGSTNAQVACERYYAFAQFRTTEPARNQDADEGQRVQELRDYRELASRMVSSIESAVTIGDLPPRAQANAGRILRQLTRVSTAGGDIWDVSRAVDARIAKSSARIEALCIAAGHTVPQELVDARERALDG